MARQTVGRQVSKHWRMLLMMIGLIVGGRSWASRSKGRSLCSEVAAPRARLAEGEDDLSLLRGGLRRRRQAAHLLVLVDRLENLVPPPD